MRNRIYFFTGTGNSLKVAKNIAEALPDCELVAICKNTSLEIPEDCERIGFVFPTYAGGPPKMVAEFIHNMELPSQGKTYLFAIATYGGNAGSVIAQTDKLIKQKEWSLNYAATIWSYPNLVIAYPMIKGVRFFTKMSNRTSRKVSKEIVSKQHESISEIKEYSRKMYDSYMIEIHGTDKDFTVNDNCISCEVCKNVCLANNITINGGIPTFQHQCESCMACIQHCPKRAINYKNKTQKRGRYTHPDIRYQTIIKSQGELL